jgi:acetyl-CoA synthetase
VTQAAPTHTLPLMAEGTSVPTAASALQRLLSPRHVAVLGGRAALEVVRQCRRLGYAGDIWPVHPSRTDMEGWPCFASVADLPCAPDAAFVAVPNVATVDVVRQLAARGAGGAICYASGFAEVGAGGMALQAELVRAAGAMALLGPNCYGLLNYLDGVALWPDQHGGTRVDRGVAIVTQSGNIGLNLTMQRRHLPLAYLITVGNQAGKRIDAIVDALLDDPRVTTIGLHIEGLDDVAAFSRVALRALERGVPLVALKAGSSELGARTTMSHTSSLAGPDVLYQALFKRFGIARVFDVGQLLETCKFLHVHGGLAGRRIVSASCSGGEASLVADLAQAQGLDMPALPEAARLRLQNVLGEKVNVANPLDYHTYIWGDAAASTEAFSGLMDCDFDAHVLVLDFPRADRCDGSSWHTTLDAFIAAKQAAAEGTVACVVSTMPEGMPDPVAAVLMAHGLAPMQGTWDCLGAIGHAAAFGQARRTVGSNAALRGLADPPTPELRPAPQTAASTALAPAARLLNESRSKALLAQWGVPVPRGAVCSAAHAPAMAQRIGLPVVVKAVSDTLAHKTEVGGVQLNLRSTAAVAEAVATMAHLSDQFLVESMERGAVAELIVGIQRDAQFGLALTIGAGGVWVELLQDSATLLFPVRRSDVHGLLQSLKMRPLLEGFRGQPGGDVEALVDAVMAIAAFGEAHADTLQELDVNPLLVFAKGHGVRAVDALIRTTDRSTT